MYKTDARRPLDPVTLVILRTLREIAATYGARHFVIGATARDILMTHVFGIDVQRATRDVDFAIALENWEQFEAIKNALIALGDFTPSQDQAHRLYYRQDKYEHAYPLDLIPFGAIERQGKVIAWPPDINVLISNSLAQHYSGTTPT